MKSKHHVENSVSSLLQALGSLNLEPSAAHGISTVERVDDEQSGGVFRLAEPGEFTRR